MFGMLKSLYGDSQSARRKVPTRSGLEVEALEDRTMMSVTNHGGDILKDVKVQAVYLGADWANNPFYTQQANYLNGYLNTIVKSPYMDMLGTAGYGVQRGSTVASKTFGDHLGSSITDFDIIAKLTDSLVHGKLMSPNSDNLYIVFVQDNVEVKAGNENSVHDFLGYHSAFEYFDTSSLSQYAIHYAVIAYPGGSVNNATLPWLSTLNVLTQVTSHELAEAVTDPNVGDPARKDAWYENGHGNEGEVGDLTNGQTVFLNNYAVQRIANKNDQAMTPAGATAVRPVSFVLKANGELWQYSATGANKLASNIASISDQGIDNNGFAFVDAVSTGGSATEYRDIAESPYSATTTYLGNNVKSAVAGQGESYLLLNDGSVWRFRDSVGHVDPTAIATKVVAINAGTDREGVSCVDVVYAPFTLTVIDPITHVSHSSTIVGAAYEISDSSGAHAIGTNVISISAGELGLCDYLTSGGKAYAFNEQAGSSLLLGSSIKQVQIGTDAQGTTRHFLLSSKGDYYEWKGGILASKVQSISKARHGLIDLIFANGDAYERTGAISHLLTNGALAAG